MTKAFANLFQVRENVTLTAARHAVKFGGEVRLARDSSYYGLSPNGEYDFGGGTAYSPVGDSLTERNARHSYRRSVAGHPVGAAYG